MTTSAVMEYNRKIPEIRRKALDALANDERRAIVEVLSEKGELSFKRLAEVIQMNPGTLNYYLKPLLHAGIVENHYKKVQSSDEYSFYQLSDFGKDMIRLFLAAK
jgi:DNA-binding transcriptional ArsR family regulator